jgi:DNA-binding LytR/AlgR family response regulator
MAVIVIAEPDPVLAELFAAVVARLGHTSFDLEHDERPARVDAIVVEPADERALAWAQLLRLLQPSVPIVFATTLPPSKAALELEPVAVLMKPFTLDELETALERALERA